MKDFISTGFSKESRKFYSESLSEKGKKQFVLHGVLKRKSFLSQIHLEKFVKNLVYSNGGFFTIIECTNEYNYKKIKRILDANLNDDCFVDENYEFKFKLVG